MTWRVLVIGAILGITAMFFFGLGRNPREIPSPLVGKEAPEFTAKTIAGEEFTSAELKGKVALVTFWATWCTTCKADEPLINDMNRTFGDNPNFQVIGIVTQDSRDAAAKYLTKGTRPYPNLYDEKGHLGINFGVYGVPETYLIDREGHIVEKIAGPINPRRLREQIGSLLAPATTPGEEPG